MKTQIDMSELSQIPKNGYSVISTFSGCGGSSLGYKLAGYDVRCALEFIPDVAKTYKLNFPNTPILQEDIRNISGKNFTEITGIKPFELDVLDGSPPCCAFSIAGNREESWDKVIKYGTTKQRVDDLFFEYARIIKDLMPKVFIAENVKGLTIGVCRPVLDEIIKTLSDIGYVVRYSVLNAKDYLVPQTRERCIFIGVRKDLGMIPVYPKPISKIISTKDAIEDLMDEDSDLPIGDLPLERLIKYFPPGVGDSDIRKICKREGISVYRSFFRRDRWNLPAYTIVHGHGGRIAHPVKNRLMSVNEAKRIQTFPDDFILPLSPLENWERIARAVPPNLMKYVSKTVQTEILDKIPKDYKITEEEFNERYRNPERKMDIQRGSHKLF